MSTTATFYPGLRVEWTENDFRETGLYVGWIENPEKPGHHHQVVQERHGVRTFLDDGTLRRAEQPTEYKHPRGVTAQELEMQRWAADGIEQSAWSSGVEKGMALEIIWLCNEVEKLQGVLAAIQAIPNLEPETHDGRPAGESWQRYAQGVNEGLRCARAAIDEGLGRTQNGDTDVQR